MTTDEPDEPELPDEPASPEDQEAVRRLLADARAGGSMPADIAARMEETLVGLSAERAADPPPVAAGARATDSGASDDSAAGGAGGAGGARDDRDDTVVPLPRGRAHRAVALLGAAAAVAVVGLGVSTFFDNDEPTAGDASNAQSAVSRGVDGDAAQEDGAADAAPSAELDASTPAQREAPDDAETVSAPRPPDRIRRGQLGRDLLALRQLELPDPAAADYGPATLSAPAGFTCGAADWGRGVVVPVQYDRRPAVVAFREPMGRTQVVEVLQCGSGQVLRSATLPVDH